MLSGKEKYNPPLGVGGASVSPDGRTGASVWRAPGKIVGWAPDPRGPFAATAAFWNFEDGQRAVQ